MAKSENEGAKKTCVNLKELYANSLSELINDYAIDEKISEVKPHLFRIVIIKENIPLMICKFVLRIIKNYN